MVFCLFCYLQQKISTCTFVTCIFDLSHRQTHQLFIFRQDSFLMRLCLWEYFLSSCEFLEIKPSSLFNVLNNGKSRCMMVEVMLSFKFLNLDHFCSDLSCWRRHSPPCPSAPACSPRTQAPPCLPLIGRDWSRDPDTGLSLVWLPPLCSPLPHDGVSTLLSQAAVHFQGWIKGIIQNYNLIWQVRAHFFFLSEPVLPSSIPNIFIWM